MIVGNLQQLAIAMLPPPLLRLLSRPDLSLHKLQQREEGKYDLIEDTLFYIVSCPTTAQEADQIGRAHV